MAEIVCKVMMALVAAPIVIGAWLVFFVLVDDTFFDGRYMDKIRAWNRMKRDEEDDDED